jgi:hypothetical protein
MSDDLRLSVSLKEALTPALLAAAFIRMDSNEQADVFHEIQKQAEASFYAQMQWAYLCQALLAAGPESPGWRFAADLGAFSMVHTYRLLEGREGRAV